MTAQEFIIKTLENWSKNFDGIKINYAYDVSAEYHVVEIEPEKIRRGNLDYKKAEMDLWLGFMKNFPNENLLVGMPSKANDMTGILFSSEQKEEAFSISKMDGFDSWSNPLDIVPYVFDCNENNECLNNNTYTLAA